MFGFQLKKKLQARAEDLIITADLDRKLANKAVYFDTFMKYYDEILACFEELCEIADKIKLHGISGDPKYDYYRLKNDKQWHMRDALEREYDRIVKEGTTVYRNNRGKTISECELFEEDIKKYFDQFDEETSEFAKALLKKLSKQFNLGLGKQDPTPLLDTTYYDFDSFEGHEFEYWCANLLRCNGFENVEVTPESGDQGVDIIAEKDDIRYAIQCKCYSSNLGNTPVQEVWAGKSMYHCQIGVVMTNRYFTKSARDLADTTGVLLWDRDKLLKMMNILK
ncbi:restriction endonuclease [Pseudoflavonifractor capillosus]|uniref:Restriction endonuclease n=1 Tax=Pseudoflavonifractor capillosus TaxID=106588 RepID=A0A921SRS8_9FIRM|nr:restriction endonuclease [Pseudoflavonifractor capillosus]HJG85687.1 restriction endonuclease [Pseudoflavonifractor capillosus]